MRAGATLINQGMTSLVTPNYIPRRHPPHTNHPHLSPHPNHLRHLLLENMPSMGGHIQVYPNALFGHLPSTNSGRPTPGAPIIHAGLLPTTPTHHTPPWAHAHATTRTPRTIGGHVTPMIGPPTHLAPATKLPAPPALAAHMAPTPPWNITAVTLASQMTASCLRYFSQTLASRTPTFSTKTCISSATSVKAGTTDTLQQLWSTEGVNPKIHRLLYSSSP
jgi:hypothetical protein